MPTSSFLAINTLPEFFKDRVCQALCDAKVKVSPDAEYYLVNLLATFTHADRLHERDAQGEVVDQPLALRLFDALQAPTDQKIPILKKMGDVALYVSGIFGDSVLSKMVNFDYYMSMGHTAYSSVSNLVDDEGGNLKALFLELAGKFSHLVDVLSGVADQTSLRNDQSLLRLYERWLATGSSRMHDALIRKGILPTELVKTKYAQ